MATRVSLENNQTSDSIRIVADIQKTLDPTAHMSAISDAVRSVAKEYAAMWVEENLDKIYDRLNVNAIANMMMIEVTKQVKDDIMSKKE